MVIFKVVFLQIKIGQKNQIYPNSYLKRFKLYSQISKIAVSFNLLFFIKHTEIKDFTKN